MQHRSCATSLGIEPVSADEGTIRGDLGDNSYEAAEQEGRALQNLVHASELDNTEDELRLWFREQV
jgi:nucleoside-diphosphate kinase